MSNLLEKKQKFDELLKAIPSLSSDQRDCLQKRLAVADGLLPAPASVSSPFIEPFYDVLAQTLQTHGHHLPAFSVFKKGTLYKIFVKQVHSIQPFLESLETSPPLKKVQRLAMYSQYVKILIESSLIFPITPRRVITHLHLLPSAVDGAFPGYADAGLLPWSVGRLPDQESEERDVRTERD